MPIHYRIDSNKWRGKGKFKIILENENLGADAVKIFGNKNDHHI